MAHFTYTGRNPAGIRVNGSVEAGSLDGAVGMIIESGVTPLEVEERGEERQALLHRLGFAGPNRGEIILFTRQMYALTRSGVPLIRGLNQLAESARNPVLREAVHQVIDDLESGRELSGALARHPRLFSPLFVSMVRVGEESGRLEEAFERMYGYLEREKETVQQIKSATRYPLFVVIALVIAVWILMTWIVPVFARIFEQYDAPLPVPTKILIGISGFFADWWPVMLVALLGATAGLRAWIRHPDGRLAWDRARVRVPGIGDIILRATLGRFARAFSMAARSGVPVLEALNVVAGAVDNAWIGRKVQAMRDGIEHGESLSRTAARTGVFTPLVLQMIAVGEETGRLDDMLEEVADFYEREVDNDVKNLTSLIEPLLTIGVALLVFLLAIGVFLPMWDLGQVAIG